MEPVQLINCLLSKVWMCILVCLEPLRLIIRFMDQLCSIYWSIIMRSFRIMIDLAYKIWLMVKSGLLESFSAINGFIHEIWSWSLSILPESFRTMIRLAYQICWKIKFNLLESFAHISGFVHEIWSWILSIIQKTFQQIHQFLEQSWVRVKSLAMRPFLHLKRIWKETWEMISEFLEPIFVFFRFVGRVWKTIMTPIMTLIKFAKHMWYFTLVLVYQFLVFVEVKMIHPHRIFDATKIKKKGQMAVVTGGGRGIGCQVVKKLLQADMDVIIGLRNQNTGHDMLIKFRAEGVKTGTLEVFSLDLASLKSVREFAKNILDKKRPVTALVNNAGIMFSPYEITEDGFESHFQVNYLSHFLLTQLLMPCLKEAGTPDAPSRVVNVSSSAHFGAWSLDFKELQVVSKERYNPYKAYASTKFLQVASANFLNAQLKDEGTNVTVNSLHPGIVATELYNQLLYARVMSKILGLIFMSIEHGADSVAYAAISPELGTQGGKFLANSQPFTPNQLSFDVGIQKKLYDLSINLIAVKK